ncbi:hypothetical protein IW15_05410 [Chryseobacterium soli]|uniref:Uncharacterized protein n=1 Tax=Chryseobacterium soli TaxID=445961 RepID=A0A086ADV8_9FLAO|nr:hypothetical protein [Chryseobacterium soli]KFF14872.1 hypothetical protein IW15_05410 [Chryseobacterium soli]
MPGLTLKRKTEYFQNEKEKKEFIFSTIDKLIVLFPDYDHFRISDFYKVIEPDISKRKKFHTITHYVESILIEKRIIETIPNYNLQYKLTDNGRIAKDKGGYRKYLKSISVKRDYVKIGSFIIAFCTSVATITFLVLNYKLTVKRDKLEMENKRLHSTIDSLKNKHKLK